jgi:predicted nucleic acid-binding protein
VIAPPAEAARPSAIVLDASVVVELLMASAAGALAMRRLVTANAVLHAPELLDVEVLHVMRRALSREQLTSQRAEQALKMLEFLPITRHAHGALRRRCWKLRANLSAYDATYVALAEGLGAVLMTRDERVARAPGLAAVVEVI